MAAKGQRGSGTRLNLPAASVPSGRFRALSSAAGPGASPVWPGPPPRRGCGPLRQGGPAWQERGRRGSSQLVPAASVPARHPAGALRLSPHLLPSLLLTHLPLVGARRMHLGQQVGDVADARLRGRPARVGGRVGRLHSMGRRRGSGERDAAVCVWWWGGPPRVLCLPVSLPGGRGATSPDARLSAGPSEFFQCEKER